MLLMPGAAMGTCIYERVRMNPKSLARRLDVVAQVDDSGSGTVVEVPRAEGGWNIAVCTKTRETANSVIAHADRVYRV